MWCVPRLDDEYVERMENVLDLLAKPLNPREPVLALDERPVQLLDSAREGRAAAPGRLARRDYEYVRRGTANIFCVIEMLAGRHFTHVRIPTDPIACSDSTRSLIPGLPIADRSAATREVGGVSAFGS
jgi:hypothetical protein